MEADGNVIDMSRGMAIFHKPMEFHALRAKNKSTPNLVVLSFEADSPVMEYFENGVFVPEQKEISCLSQMGMVEYFNNIKMIHAKELIRANEMNFSQIAEHLAFSSAPHFSKRFKQKTGMSPSENAKSIRCITEQLTKVTPKRRIGNEAVPVE